MKWSFILRNQLLSLYSKTKNLNNNTNQNQDRSFFRDPVFFIAIGTAVLTLGLALTMRTSESFVLGIGFTLTTLIYIYYRSRLSSRDPILFVIVAILVITFGFALLLEESVSLVFACGFGLIGLTLIINGFFRPIFQSQSSSKTKRLMKNTER